MGRTKPKKSSLRPASLRWFLTAVVLMSTGASLLIRTPMGVYLENRVARTFDFRVREKLGRSPRVDPRLKIYALDDKAFSAIGRATLGIDEWAAIFSTLSRNKPRLVMIDSFFSAVEDPRGNRGAALERLHQLETLFAASAFVTFTELAFRETLSLEGRNEEFNRQTSLFSLPAVDAQKKKAYGPAPELNDVFKGVGHVVYDQSSGRVDGVLRLDSGRLLPHLSLLAAETLEARNGEIWINGVRMPLTAERQAYVNFIPPQAFKPYSFLGLYKLAQEEKESRLVKEGDVVLIIPAAFTGNTDFKETPIGELPGGYIIATLVNSVLTGAWLDELPYRDGVIAAGAFLGAGLTVLLPSSWFWLVSLLGTLLIVATGQILFSYLGLIVPWLFCGIAFLFAALWVFARRAAMNERRALLFRVTFEGSLPEGRLQGLLKSLDTIDLTPREKTMTIMFLDIVGFSLTSANQKAGDVFEALQQLLFEFSEVIHEFGGIVDKTLGDGLLAYFGHGLGEGEFALGHEQRAFLCAKRIQELNLERNLKAEDEAKAIYPVRIGLNTAPVYVGDLGTGLRIDYTAVGSGVNFAKRLESACDSQAIMMAKSTVDGLVGLSEAQWDKNALQKSFVQVKHVRDVIECYQYDPIMGRAQDKRRMLEAFRRHANLERIESRWLVVDPKTVTVGCAEARGGTIVNLSRAGIQVSFDVAIAKGAILSLSFESGDEGLKKSLERAGLASVSVEVKWCSKEGGKFLHGLKYTDLSNAQMDALFGALFDRLVETKAS